MLSMLIRIVHANPQYVYSLRLARQYLIPMSLNAHIFVELHVTDYCLPLTQNCTHHR